MVTEAGDSLRLIPSAPGYPTGLLDLEDPPPIYVRGTFHEGPHVAIVGTRTCTRYGIVLAEAAGSALAEVGWVTVSGLARGIDAAAHRGTVRSQGAGVAILGSGIDVIYPRENRPILEGLVRAGGAVVSEYPTGTPPDRWRFPARNRLIAAMAAAVVVVESGLTGGSHITAVLAAELGRPVLAFPGDVDRPSSVGANRLIRDGAIPVLGIDDMLDELSLIVGVTAQRRPAKNTSIPVGGLPIEDLATRWNCSPSEALARLGMLELEGKVRREGHLVLPPIRAKE